MGPLKQICYAIKSLHFFSRMPDKNLKEVVFQIGLSYEYRQDRVIVNQFAYTLTSKFESIFLFILLFWNASHSCRIMRALRVSITKTNWSICFKYVSTNSDFFSFFNSKSIDGY